MPICADKLKELFPEYDQKKIDRLMGEISRMKDAEGNLGESLGKIRQRIEDRALQIRLNAAKYKAQAAMNLQKLTEWNKFKNQDLFKNDPIRALKAFVGGGENALGRGVNLGIKDMAANFTDQILRPAYAQLEAKGLLDRVRTGELDKGIAIALDQMRPGGNLNHPDISPSALEAAQIFRSINDQKRLIMENAGYPTGFIEGYKGPQTHDQIKIKDNKDGWMKSMLENLDHEKTFGEGATLAQKTKYLEDSYKKISDGIWTKDQVPPGATDKFQTVSEKGLGAKTIGSREFHFKDGESFYNYNKEFGQGTLFQNLLPSIDRYARNASALSRLGTNPKETFANLIDKEERFYKSDAGIEKAGADQAAKIVNDIKASREQLLNFYDNSAGVYDGGGMLMPAKILNATRNFMNMTKLGSAVFKKSSELGFAAGLAKATTGEDMINSSARMIKDWFGILGKEKENMMVQQLLIRHIDDTNAFLSTDRYGSGYNEPGAFSKAADVAYKYFGINWHTNKTTAVAAGNLARILETHVGSSFEELPTRLSSNFQRYNINKPEWDVLSKSVGTFEHDGSKAILSDQIMKLSDSDAQKIIDDNNLKYKSPEAFKFDVQNKYIAFLNDHSQRSVLHSTLPVQSFIRSFDRNTVPGMLWQMAMQYKSVAFMMKENMARVVLSNPEKMANSLSEAFKSPVKGGDVFNNLVPMMAYSTALYGVSKFLKDELVHLGGEAIGLRGTEKDPLKEAEKHPLGTIGEAFIGGGGGGMAVDMLGQNTWDRTRRTLEGPTLSTAEDLASAGWKMATNKGTYPNSSGLKEGAKQLVDTMRSLVPGSSLPLAKSALDSLIFDHIKTAIDPRYLEKKELAQKRQELKDAH